MKRNLKKSSKETELADILFPSATEEEQTESILSIPPEQRRLHTDTYDFTVSTLLDNIKRGSIYIPEFQRKYVWSTAQASRLVESLIIQCPIPVIYLSQEKDERQSVIDGNQRLQSLLKFVNNEFALSGLTAYPELEGLLYQQLDARFQRHIMNRTLRCMVILKDTHPQVKFDVFERLNTGSVKLNAQELRHGLYFGKLMKLAAKLAKLKKWQDILDITHDKRMKSEELVIRFLALQYDWNNYKKPLSLFLNTFSDKYRDLSLEKEAEFTVEFERTVDNVISLFGSLVFKVFDESQHVLSKFNAALFDAEMIAAGSYRNRLRVKAVTRKNIHKGLVKLFEEEDFQKTITRATSDDKQLKKRIEAVKSMLKRHV